MNGITVIPDEILSAAERQKLQALQDEARELQLLAATRLETKIGSLNASQLRYQEACTANHASLDLYHEALLQLFDDADDDFDLACEKREKAAQVEEDYLAAGVRLQEALTRFEWEIKQVEAPPASE